MDLEGMVMECYKVTVELSCRQLGKQAVVYLS